MARPAYRRWQLSPKAAIAASRVGS